MKKSIMLLFVIGTIAFMSSCKKEYTCYCHGESETVNYNKTVQIKASKKEADAVCAAQTSTSFGVTTTCKL